MSTIGLRRVYPGAHGDVCSFACMRGPLGIGEKNRCGGLSCACGRMPGSLVVDQGVEGLFPCARINPSSISASSSRRVPAFRIFFPCRAAVFLAAYQSPGKRLRGGNRRMLKRSISSRAWRRAGLGAAPSHSIGFILARVGEGRLPTSYLAGRAVYPHARERISADSSGLFLRIGFCAWADVSPRPEAPRFISVHAGEGYLQRRQRQNGRVYPRVRGGGGWCSGATRAMGGLSPCASARRRVWFQSEAVLPIGSIPPRVGGSCVGSQAAADIAVYPRVRAFWFIHFLPDAWSLAASAPAFSLW